MSVNRDKAEPRGMCWAPPSMVGGELSYINIPESGMGS